MRKYTVVLATAQVTRVPAVLHTCGRVVKHSGCILHTTSPHNATMHAVSHMHGRPGRGHPSIRRKSRLAHAPPTTHTHALTQSSVFQSAAVVIACYPLCTSPQTRPPLCPLLKHGPGAAAPSTPAPAMLRGPAPPRVVPPQRRLLPQQLLALQPPGPQRQPVPPQHAAAPPHATNPPARPAEVPAHQVVAPTQRRPSQRRNRASPAAPRRGGQSRRESGGCCEL